MLQPRKRKFILKIEPNGLLLCIIILLTFTHSLQVAKGEDEKHGLTKEKLKRSDRVIRHGNVNIVVLDDFDRRKVTPSLGLLSTTARTFIQEGTTTEYATHIYGTTLGDRYAHIVSTGSKIFYENARPSKEKNDHVIISLPSLDSLFEVSEDNVIVPSSVVNNNKNVEKVSTKQLPHAVPGKEEVLNKNAKSLKANIPLVTEQPPVIINTSVLPEQKKFLNQDYIKKETLIKPAKAKQKNELPTFTIKQDSFQIESSVNQIQNSEFEVDNTIRNPHYNHIINNLEVITTTYFGFADFVTTAGNTVIVFTPKTKTPSFGGSVTTIDKEPNLNYATNVKDINSLQPTTISTVNLTVQASSIISNLQTTDNIQEVTEICTETSDELESITTEKEVSLSPLEEQPNTTEVEDDSTELVTEIDSNSMLETTTKEDTLVKNNYVPLHNNYSSTDPAILSNNSLSSVTEYFTTFLTTIFLPGSTNTPGTTSKLELTEALPSIINEANNDVNTQSTITNTGDEVTERNETGTTIPHNKIPEKKPIDNTTTVPVESNQPEEEVALVFKTLYTTYTYLTTYFEKSTSSINKREEVVTNVVTSTLDNNLIDQATDPAIAGLFSSYRKGKFLYATASIAEISSSFSPNIDTNEEDISSTNWESVYSESKKPTPSLNSYSKQIESSTFSLNSIPIVEKLNNTKIFKVSNTPTTEWNHPVSSKLPYAFRNHNHGPFRSVILKHSPSSINKLSSSSTAYILINQSMSKLSENSIILEKVSSISSTLLPKKENFTQGLEKLFLKNYLEDDDQLSEESNTEDTYPSQSLISLQTSYTTYTYFSTIYKSSSSDIISHLETVTNINTEIITPSSTEIAFIEESTIPLTYYTTYTYWTTFYKDGSTMIKSRQEVVSNIDSTTTMSLKPSITASTVTNSQNLSSITLPTPTEPITYYTTFTYFTTSYIGNSSIIYSHFETITNEVDATKGNADLSVVYNGSLSHYPVFQSSISSIPTSLDNKTNLKNITIHSNTEDVISLEEGKVIDGFKISTTFYTTKIIGTYIQQLYAQLIESTSSIKVNSEFNTNLIKPPTAVINDKTYQTGLLQLKEGSIIKYGTTTLYKTEIIGTIVDDQYKSITKSSSSINFMNVNPTKVHINPTSVADVSSNLKPTLLNSMFPSQSVVESSITDALGDEVEDKEKLSKSKSFTPVIRPFASRSRPTFQPKKKSSDILSATTITRGITPTIVAIPALKSSENRIPGNKNRFQTNSRKSFTNTPISELNSRGYSRSKYNSLNLLPSSSSSKLASIKNQPSVTSYKRGNFRPTSKLVDLSSYSTTGTRFRVNPTPRGKASTFASTALNLDNNETIEEQLFSPNDNDDSVIETSTLQIIPTTESSRRYNPLLRFKKPVISESTTFKPIPIKNLSSKNEKKVTTLRTLTTIKPYNPRTVNYFNNNNRARLKPTNDFISSTTTNKYEDVEVETDTELFERSSENVESITHEFNLQSISSTKSGKYVKNTNNTNLVSIKPFTRKNRVRRQAEYGYKYENTRSPSKNRNMPVQSSYPDYLYYDDYDLATEDPSIKSHNRNVYTKSRTTEPIQQAYLQYQHYQLTTPAQQLSPRIRASSVSNSRSPFTLREKYSSTSQTPTTSQRFNRRTTKRYDSISTTKRSLRQRTYSTTSESPFYRNNRKQSSTRRTNSKSRYKDKDNEYNLNTYSSIIYDGTITVTHKIPTEVTIPFVNGKVTEYKNVITAKPSIQILAPHQYSTITGKNGLSTLQLINENTETMSNGLIEVTKYILNEFPTSSITYSPTSIRGRKTSVSQVIPSTIYEVRPEVSTINPHLNANAPLANLILSQLLLGNLGIQQTMNPLLGLNQGASVSPITEFKTKTTSYVTTLTHSTSSVIPITFRGKEIKTTVVDSSTQVITATEYITESVIITPTPSFAPINGYNNQLQTLLLPALLQAQLLNQVHASNGNDSLQLLSDIPSPSKASKYGPNLDSENLQNEDSYEQKGNKNKGKLIDSPIEPAETSVVTLYLSGRKPGEFSTVLSTVILDEEKLATLQKRHIKSVSYELEPSQLLEMPLSLLKYEDEYFDSVIKSGINDIPVFDSKRKTENLESILGTINKHVFTKDINIISKTKAGNQNQQTNHFLLNTSTESAPFQWNPNFLRSSRDKRDTKKKLDNQNLFNYTFKDTIKLKASRLKEVHLLEPVPLIEKLYVNNDIGSSTTGTIDDSAEQHQHKKPILYSAVDDEGRGKFNLATKVMSNGVEVIVALDKSTLPGSPQVLRVLPTSNIKPITFTPHTVTDHMIMMLPHGLQDTPNPFITKTYLTTYTYLTTLLEAGITTVSSEEKVISNIITDMMATQIDSTNDNIHITLDSSPIMATKVYQTTYNMESTVKDGDYPQIIVNQQTVSNTITAPNNVQTLLLPSEPSYNDIQSGPSKDGPNEELYIKVTETPSLHLHTSNNDGNIDVKTISLQAADITKTYFVTYTYLSTLLENGSTVIKSNVATSSDVVTEKYYLPLRRTKIPSSSINEALSETNTPLFETALHKLFHIFATKTYLTTYTYFTTLLQDKGSKPAQTLIQSHTKVMQNLVTETVDPSLLNKEYLVSLKDLLRNESVPITTTATLNDGQKLEITAINENPAYNVELSDRLSSSLEESEGLSTGITQQAIIEKNYNNSFITSILHSTTVMKNGATYLPGSPVIKFTHSTGNVSIIPLAEPVNKYPNNIPSQKLPINNILNFGNLGINSLSALKPVLNAVADLWQSNIKSNIKNRNELHKKPVHPYLETNQIELNTILKPPNRSPIYIPVGSILEEDNEEAGSEDIVEQYPDINIRNNQGSKSKPTVEQPLVSGGGIPISPGQVITANTDVIVGTPAVHGPRPPIENHNDKSDVIGMKPPPIGQKISSFSEQSNERVVSNGYKLEDIVKIPPKPLSPTFSNNGFRIPNYGKHPGKVHYKPHIDQKIPMSSEVRFSHLSLTPAQVEHIRNDLMRDNTSITPPIYEQLPHYPALSSQTPLLVDVRPSEVAQVIIPHSGQNAFAYRDQPTFHTNKGEIFNDPLPYPEDNVNPGFIGLKVLGPTNIEGASKQSSNTIHLDIPINPYIDDGTITESHHFVTLNLEGKPQSPYNILSSVLKAPQENIIFKRPTFNLNTTTPQKIDILKVNHPFIEQQPEIEQNSQHPYIFPMNKPIATGNYPLSTTESDIKDYNNVAYDNDDSLDYGSDSQVSNNDGLTQETKDKLTSNPQTHININEANINTNLDIEFNQNWETLKERPLKQNSSLNNIKNKFSSSTHQDNNSSNKGHSEIKYDGWNIINQPISKNGVNISSTYYPFISKGDPTENSRTDNKTQPISSINSNAQSDVVIGLQPPPLPPILQPSSVKHSRPSNSKLPIRPHLKNKIKPTNHPYPFENPNRTNFNIIKPKPTVISKPPPNILYETDAPNFTDEILKLKPLNTTGKIEPVNKWQSTSKLNFGHTVHGNVEKVNNSERRDESRSSTPSSITINNDDSLSDSNNIINKDLDTVIPNKPTELISKWNNDGIISTSKTDLDESEYYENTPALDINKTKYGTNTNTIFGNLYTRPPPANIVIIPTQSTTQHYTAISMVIDQANKSDERNSGASFTIDLHPGVTSQLMSQSKKKEILDEHSATPHVQYITHTKTTSVTITQTTIVHRDGQPSTRTIVETKTQTTTLIDTVTKTQTLLQPTSILSTITTTIPVIASKDISVTKSNLEMHSTVSTLKPIYDENLPLNNNSILLVVGDKKSGTGGTGHIIPISTETRPTGYDIQVPDEANEPSPNDIQFSGIYTIHSESDCRPECKVTKNEMCQKINNNMRCICRPGFARLFPDHPCKPIYTYIMRVPLERQGGDQIYYTESLSDQTSPSHQQLTEAARDGLDRMAMQSNIRDIYHRVEVSGFEPAQKSDRAVVVYLVQLSENTEQVKLQDEIHRTLKANNFSLGGTDIFAVPDMLHSVQAEDFDECISIKYHDCADNAQCLNLHGRYTCICKEGFTDMSYSTDFPGRICSADAIGCELCNYHGTCYYKTDEETTCECFQWYAGEFCQVNLKVTLITLITIGILLSMLLIVCLVITCNKQKPPEILCATPKPHMGFRRYRSVTNLPGDKRAIVSIDTSSEGSIERTPPPFIKQRVVQNEPPMPIIIPNVPNCQPSSGSGEPVQSSERDRSLTVLIPRAKYRPVSSQPSSTLLTMSTFGPEQKLLNYSVSRDCCQAPEKKVSACSMHSRKLSNSTIFSIEPIPKKKNSAPARPSSGALVSAGFEVSATVRRTQELDEAYTNHPHNDSSQPTYNSIRMAESSLIVDVPILHNIESSLEDFIARVDKLGTVSEARSYDETTIQPPMRSLHHIFRSQTHTCDSKHSSSQKDEHHTMGERDLGSTYMPKSQLYKPDHRESDGSNFDSL